MNIKSFSCHVMHCFWFKCITGHTQANKEQRSMLLESVVRWPLRMDFEVYACRKFSSWELYAFSPAVLSPVLAYTLESLWGSVYRNSVG